jgi:hypothetical protein
MTNANEWSNCYRVKSTFRNVGVAGILFSVAMTILSLIAWWNQPPNDPVKMPLVVAVFVLFTILGAYLLLMYVRYRLLFSNRTIRRVGVFCDDQIQLDTVDEIRWPRSAQGGSVVITARTNTLKIELTNFERDDRQNIVEFLRTTVPASRQIGRQRFFAKFDQEFVDTPEKRKKTKRIYFLITTLFGFHAVAFGSMWAAGAGFQFLVFSVINALMVAYLVRLRRQKQDTDDSNPG